MNFSTFYFSGTGNTEWTVREFNKYIIKRGHQGELFSIEIPKNQDVDLLKNILRESDYIGFAHPIYGANVPPIMRDFINKIMELLSNEEKDTKPVYIINTFGYINAFGPIAMKKIFSNTGLELISYINIRLCNNIVTPKIKTNNINPNRLEKRKEKAVRRLKKMSEKLFIRESHITGIGPYLIPGIFIRKKLKKKIENNYKSLSVNTKTCNGCMLCVEKCPTNSIEYMSNKFKFSSSCTACMRCYNFCPTYSILLDGIFADPNIYKRHRGVEASKTKNAR